MCGSTYKESSKTQVKGFPHRMEIAMLDFYKIMIWKLPIQLRIYAKWRKFRYVDEITYFYNMRNLTFIAIRLIALKFQLGSNIKTEKIKMASTQMNMMEAIF